MGPKAKARLGLFRQVSLAHGHGHPCTCWLSCFHARMAAAPE